MGVNPTIMDTPGEAETQISSTGGPIARLVGDVVLHAGAEIDLSFDRFDRAAKTFIELSRVQSVRISQGVVDVLLGAIDAEALFGDFEFLGRISEREE